MQVLLPISTSNFTSLTSTIAEPAAGETQWLVGTAYVTGDEVILTSTHRRYRALQNSTGKDPSLIANYTYWADIGPTNKYGMFDGNTSFPSSATGGFTVVVQPGFFNSIVMMGLNAASATITVKDKPGGAVIFSETVQLEGSTVGDWYEYFFSGFSPRTDYIASNIEPYSTAEVTIVLSGSGSVSCGVLAFGDLRNIGNTQYGAKANPRSYSTVKVNTDGTQSIVRRRSGNDMTATCFIDLSEANSVYATLVELMDVPAFWIGTDISEYNGLRSWGLGKGSISYDYPSAAFVSIEITGLIK